MENISAPGRMEFIRSEKPEGCVFCKESARDESLILYDDGVISYMLNKYPYNTGHVLIVTNRHVGELDELTPEERFKIMEGMEKIVTVLKQILNPQGFNIGLNLGQAAGAGIVDHFHLHVVPRWNGDTNFMTCVAETRVTPEDVTVTCRQLKPMFEKMVRGGVK